MNVGLAQAPAELCVTVGIMAYHSTPTSSTSGQGPLNFQRRKTYEEGSFVGCGLFDGCQKDSWKKVVTMKRIIVIFVALALVSCSSYKYIGTPPAEMAAMTQNDSLVFGWVKVPRLYVESGKTYMQKAVLSRGLFGWMFGYQPKLILHFEDKTSGVVKWTELPAWGDESQPFEFILPAGHYSITIVHYGTSPAQQQNAIEVVGGRCATYVGDLQVHTRDQSLKVADLLRVDQSNFETRRADWLKIHPGFAGCLVQASVTLNYITLDDGRIIRISPGR